MKLNAAARLVASEYVKVPESKAKAEVTRFCKMNGIDLNGKQNLPTLYKEKADLLEQCDNWNEARKFLLDLYRQYQDSGKKSAWLD